MGNGQWAVVRDAFFEGAETGLTPAKTGFKPRLSGAWTPAPVQRYMV